MRVALEVLRINGDAPELRTKLMGLLNNHVDELSSLLEALVTDPLSFKPTPSVAVDSAKPGEPSCQD